ncbi:methionine ABC transporter permease, partial [Clostridium botulinum]|nr:methionine ABC transporter permease [Clostridium botulinum]
YTTLILLEIIVGIIQIVGNIIYKKLK